MGFLAVVFFIITGLCGYRYTVRLMTAEPGNRAHLARRSGLLFVTGLAFAATLVTGTGAIMQAASSKANTALARVAAASQPTTKAGPLVTVQNVPPKPPASAPAPAPSPTPNQGQALSPQQLSPSFINRRLLRTYLQGAGLTYPTYAVIPYALNVEDSYVEVEVSDNQGCNKTMRLTVIDYTVTVTQKGVFGRWSPKRRWFIGCTPKLPAYSSIMK